MNASENDFLHAAIGAKLASIVAASSAQPAWYEDWKRLGPKATEDERLAVYQAIRNSGCLPSEAGFYLVSWQIDAMTSLDAHTSLRHLEVRLIDFQLAAGYGEDEFWPSGKAPDEYEDLRLQYLEAWDRMFASKLAVFGEQEMAALFLSDPEEFERRSDIGRQYFHGADDPEAWLDDLAEAVAGNMEAQSAPGPLGLRYQEEDGIWEVVAYPKPVELVGGADDGELVTPPFALDLEGLRAVFERVDAFSWLSLGYPNGDGPHVAIEGVYQGHEVFLQVLAYPPDDEEPGMKINTQRRDH